MTCEQMVNILSEKPECENVDLCDYNACADAIAAAPCDVTPDECSAIIDCLDIGETATCARLIEVSMVGAPGVRHVQVDSESCTGHLTLEVSSWSKETGMLDDVLFLGAAGECVVYGGEDGLAADFGAAFITIPGDPGMTSVTMQLMLDGVHQDAVQIPLDVVPATPTIPDHAVRLTTDGDWRITPRAPLLATCDPMTL